MTPVPASTSFVDFADAPPLPPTEKRLQAMEAACLYLMAFGGALFISLFVLSTRYQFDLNTASSAASHSVTIATQVVLDLGILGLFWALMQRRGGLSVLARRGEAKDVLRGIGLCAVADLAYYVCAIVASLSLPLLGQSLTAQKNIGMFNAAGQSLGATVLLFTYGLVNPFVEECIARAWTQYHLERLFRWRPWQAALLSALLQATYHFYQGTTYVVLYFVTFFLFGLYYARTRRLWPVIIAHLIGDMSAIVYTLAAAGH